MIDHGPSYDQTCKAAMAAQCLLGAFLWRESKEGYTYWESIYDRLVAIAKGEDP